MWTGDPLRDFDLWDAQKQKELDRLPKCAYCNQPMTDDYCYEINDEYICEDCLKANHRKCVDDLIR